MTVGSGDRPAGRSLSLLDPTYASKYIPIIASVSEHQPPAWTSYFTDLNVLVRWLALIENKVKVPRYYLCLQRNPLLVPATGVDRLLHRPQSSGRFLRRSNYNLLLGQRYTMR